MTRINKAAYAAYANSLSNSCCCRVSNPVTVKDTVGPAYVTVFSNLEINGTTYQVTARVRKEDFRVINWSFPPDYSQASQPNYDANGDIILEWKVQADADTDTFLWKVDYTFNPPLPPIPSGIYTRSEIISNDDGGKSPHGNQSGLNALADGTTTIYYKQHQGPAQTAQGTVITAITANDQVKKIIIKFINYADPSNPIVLAENFLLLDFNVLWL
jgi:hypothetical protein